MPDLVHDAGFAGPIDSITDAEVLEPGVEADRYERAEQAEERREAAREQATPEPDPAALERNIRRRRRDLVNHIDELERVVRAKLDVKERVRRGSERVALRAERALDRFVQRVREKPLPYLVAGAAIVLLLFGGRGRRHRRYDRDW
jgi:hypothetical protein